MVKKLKTKLVIKSLFSSLFNFPSISAKILPFLAVFLFAGLLLNINQAKATENIDANSVQVKTELLINGKADNLVRTYTGGTAQFSVTLTVTQAKNKSASNLDGISLNSDLLDFGVSGNFDRTITQFGAGVGKSNNDNCSTRTVTAFIGSNKVFAECSFVGSQALSSGNVEVGKQYKFDFTLDSAAINNLALTSPCPRNAQTTACFTAWPYLYLSKVGVDRKLAVTGASKDIYVQNFPDKVAMDAAIAANQRPSDVPGYGGNTGGAEIGGGGNRMAALINEILGVLIGFVQELVYGIFYWLIAPLIQAMLSIRVYTDTFVAVIYPGWEVIRNICNIFFIVALMVIALATLFRVDSYQTRPLLIQLILAALMINFSLVIAQAILALADTIQAQFLPANVTVIRSLAGDLMVGTYRDLYGTKAFADASFAGIIKPLFFLAMSIGSFAVFTAIAVFLLIRIVALWLLLLISPIAYAVGVLPSTAQYRKTWWDNFLKYAFFTPIMAFFLNLTAVMSNKFKDITILQSVTDERLVNELGNSDIASFVFKVASNVLLLVFLIAALKVADIAGVYGASGITSIAQKGIFAPFAATAVGIKVGSGFAAQKIHKKYGIELRPSEWKHAYENYKKKRVEEDKQIGGAVAEERREHGSELLAKLGAPEDFFRVFLNPNEWKRIGAGGQRGALKAYEHASEVEKELSGYRDKDDNWVKGMISKTDKKKKQDEIDAIKRNIKTNDNNLGQDQFYFNNELDAEGNPVDQFGFDNKQKLEKFFAMMEDKAKSLRESGDESGSKSLSSAITKMKKKVKDGEDKGPVTLDLKEFYNVKDVNGNLIDSGVKEQMGLFIEAEKSENELDLKALQTELDNKKEVEDLVYTNKLKEMYAARNKGDLLRSPESYEHRLERLHLESQESSKLKGIDNAEQLQALAIEAIRSKNRFRMAAVHKKMAEDYNDNEFLNLTPRTKNGKPVLDENGMQVSYGSGSQGMKDYMEEVYVHQMGMDHQSALQLVDEISYINEKKNHWENARNVSYKNGELHFSTEENHTIAAMVEITKRGPRDVAREFNRLAIGTEIQDAAGNRKFRLSKLGIAFAKIVGTQLHSANQMGFMTGSMLRRFAENKDILLSNGVPKSVVEDMVRRAAVAPLDPVDAVKKAHLGN